MNFRPKLTFSILIVLATYFTSGVPISALLARSLQTAQPPIILRGAGATFPAPIYAKWFANFNQKHSDLQFTYDAVGSEAGIRELLSGAVDFGASDFPQVVHELAPQSESKYLFFPSVIGAVVPIINLPGVTKEIAITPEALAGIYLGTIKKWSDPVLRQANPGVSLPDLDVTVIHRSDGSGTSYTWTDYLSQASPEWKARAGASMNPKWVVGRPAGGNDGVAKLVRELGGSIGYVEYIFALRNHLSYAQVQNKNGEFVSANLESITAAANNSVALDSDFKGSIVNAPGKGSYPIASFSWLVVPSNFEDRAKHTGMLEFLKWMIGPGQRQAATLGYVAIPESVVSREEAAIGKVQ